MAHDNLWDYRERRRMRTDERLWKRPVESGHSEQWRTVADCTLAEGEELESNILQLCPPSKCLDREAFCMAIMLRGAFSEAAGRGGQVRIPLCPPNPQVRQ